MPVISNETKTRTFKVVVEYPKEFKGEKIKPEEIADVINSALCDGLFNAWDLVTDTDEDDLNRYPDNYRSSLIASRITLDEVRT